MNRKYLVLIIVTFVVFFKNSFSQSDTISFNLLLQGLEQNYKLKDNALNTDSVFKIRKEINNISYLPQLNLISQATYQSDVTQLPVTIPNINIPMLDKDQYKVALEVNQLIYDGSITKIKNKRDAVAAELEAVQSKINLTNLKDILNKWVYLYLINNKIKEQLEIQKSTLVEKQREIEQLINNGLATASDLDILKVEVLKIEQQIDAIDNTCQSIAANIEIITTFRINGKILTYENENFVISDTINRVELIMYEKKKNITFLNAELVNQLRLPQLFAFGQTGYGKPGLNMLTDEFDTYYLVGVKMVWNIYDWNKSFKEKKIAAINQKSIDNECELFKQNIKIQANELIASIQKTERLIEKDYKIIELRDNILKSTSAKLINGTAKTSDYINDLNFKTQVLIDLEKHKIEKQYYIQSYKILMGLKY